MTINRKQALISNLKLQQSVLLKIVEICGNGDLDMIEEQKLLNAIRIFEGLQRVELPLAGRVSMKGDEVDVANPAHFRAKEIAELQESLGE